MSKENQHIPIALELIKGCQQGNAKHQELLFHHFAPLVMSTCLRYAATASDAEDLFQEAFITIFEQIKYLRNPEGIVSWIYKITVSKAIRYYHKRIRWEEMGEKNSYPSAAIEQNEIIDTLSANELLELIQKMPDGYRLVFNLYEVEGYSHTEIAQLLGITEVTSRSQLFKAKRWLKKIFLETASMPHYEKRIG